MSNLIAIAGFAALAYAMYSSRQGSKPATIDDFIDGKHSIKSQVPKGELPSANTMQSNSNHRATLFEYFNAQNAHEEQFRVSEDAPAIG